MVNFINNIIYIHYLIQFYYILYKLDLEKRGLKASGTLRQRAERLFSIKGVSPSKIDNKLKAKKN